MAISVYKGHSRSRSRSSDRNVRQKVLYHAKQFMYINCMKFHLISQKGIDFM